MVKYNRVEELARKKEMEVRAKERDFKTKFQSHHMTAITVLTPNKAKAFSVFFTGDVKGNLISWKLSDPQKTK